MLSIKKIILSKTYVYVKYFMEKLQLINCLTSNTPKIEKITNIMLYSTKKHECSKNSIVDNLEC